jgi:hypothetical protein
MKYKPEMYLDSGVYSDGDDDIDNKKEKVVKCRKQHECTGCRVEIAIGMHALRETGFIDGEPVSRYTCLPCIEVWLVESGQIDSDDAQ